MVGPDCWNSFNFLISLSCFSKNFVYYPGIAVSDEVYAHWRALYTTFQKDGKSILGLSVNAKVFFVL